LGNKKGKKEEKRKKFFVFCHFLPFLFMKQLRIPESSAVAEKQADFSQASGSEMPIGFVKAESGRPGSVINFISELASYLRLIADRLAE